MPVTVREEGADLVFRATDGYEIARFEGAGRKFTVHDGAGLDADVSTSALLLADGSVTKAKVGSGVTKVATVDVDCGAGGTAQTAAIVTLPANSVVLEVHARCTEAFDGDATQDLAVGVAGTAAKYLASADFENGADDINAADEAFASALGTPTAPVSVPAGEAIIATWTNAASATTGIVRVSVAYYVEDV